MSISFGISVNKYEQRPVAVTRTFTKCNRVIVVGTEELSKFFRDGSQIYLERVDRRIKDFLSSMKRVGDDDNF